MFFKAIKSLALAGVISIGCLANVSAADIKFFTIGTAEQLTHIIPLEE